VGCPATFDALERRFEQIGLKPDALQIFFARMLRDAFALEAAGRYSPRFS
jgi:hypothetical protein